ncbi:reverse transcriptase domain-containing protein [Tanacetum coccineum]
MFFSSYHSHDLRTMEDFHRMSLIGTVGPIVLTTVLGTDFVLKNHMVQLLRHNCQFHGYEGEDANDHLNKYLSITQFIKKNGVSQDIINLNLFPFSLTHEAESWFYTLKTHSIRTWEEMVSKFLSKYFPYSRTLQLRREILNFWQLPTESVFEAWEDLNLVCGNVPTIEFCFLIKSLLFTMELRELTKKDLWRLPATTFASRERVEVLGKQSGYTIQSVQHNPGPGHPNTFYYSDFDESDDDEPSKIIKDQKSIHHFSGSPTPSSDPVVASLSPSLTPTGDSDSILEETDTLLPHHDSTSPEVDDDIFDPEEDICLLERLLNLDSTKDLPHPYELNNEIFDPEGDILILENLLKDDP